MASRASGSPNSGPACDRGRIVIVSPIRPSQYRRRNHLQTLMRRVNPNGPIPEPHIWYECARFLLRHGHSSNIERKLRTIESQSLGDAAILALEHFPDAAVEIFRKALRSRIPCNRITAAAALAIIDQPWSRAELTAVLNECDDQVMTAECRSALLHAHSEGCHHLVRRWEKQNPHEPEQGEWVTMEEMSLRQSDDRMSWELQELHDRLMPLRETVPLVPKRRWWRLRG